MTTLKYVEVTVNAAIVGQQTVPLNLIAQGAGSNQRTGSSVQLIGWEANFLVYNGAVNFNLVPSANKISLVLDNNNAGVQTTYTNVWGSTFLAYGFNQDPTRYNDQLHDIIFQGSFNKTLNSTNANFGPFIETPNTWIYRKEGSFPPDTIQTFSGTGATVADVSTNLFSLVNYLTQTIQGKFRVYFIDV